MDLSLLANTPEALAQFPSIVDNHSITCHHIAANPNLPWPLSMKIIHANCEIEGELHDMDDDGNHDLSMVAHPKVIRRHPQLKWSADGLLENDRFDVKLLLAVVRRSSI